VTATTTNGLASVTREDAEHDDGKSAVPRDLFAVMLVLMPRHRLYAVDWWQGDAAIRTETSERVAVHVTPLLGKLYIDPWIINLMPRQLSGWWAITNEQGEDYFRFTAARTVGPGDVYTINAPNGELLRYM
jgi:hypothetical protein